MMRVRILILRVIQFQLLSFTYNSKTGDGKVSRNGSDTPTSNHRPSISFRPENLSINYPLIGLAQFRSIPRY
jgi:hypothetical protein